MAAQAMAGFVIELTPKLGFAVNYRFWRAPSITLNKPSGEKIKTDFSKYGLTIGASYALSDEPNALVESSYSKDHEDLYTIVRIGPGFAHDANIDASTTNFDAFDIGAAVSICAGYTLKNLRFELEAISFNNPADIIDFGSSSAKGEVRAHGKVAATGVMANILYDFNLGLFEGSTVRPFGGFGIGYSLYDYRIKAGDTDFVTDKDRAISAQAIIGISVELTPGKTFTFDYRYWGAPHINLTGSRGYDIDTYHSVHGVMLGLRYSFD
jgi:opacity protein-like surface antigen